MAAGEQLLRGTLLAAELAALHAAPRMALSATQRGSKLTSRHRHVGRCRYSIRALTRKDALVLFIATHVEIGSEGTPLDLSGTLGTCRLLGFEERLGNEVSGMLLGIAQIVAQTIWTVQSRKLWNTLDLVNGSP